MITAFFFFIHFVFALYSFTKRWQEEGLGAAFLIVVFIGIIFSVGWTISAFLMGLFVPPTGFGKFYNRDTISLTLLTVLEIFFFGAYFKGKFRTQIKKKEKKNEI